MLDTEDLGHFDILCVGTDVSASMTAAVIQSKNSGKRVLQLEHSSHYGGNPMVDSPKGFIVDSIPLLCFAKGPVIEALRSSGAAEHIEFSPIDKLIFICKETALSVPFTREDIFSNTQLSFLEKRKLMKLLQSEQQEIFERNGSFLNYLMKDFGLSEKLALMLITSVCFYSKAPGNLSVKDGLLLCKRFAESAGVYGPFPLLYPAYGAREVAQAFCRVCAVSGGIQVLNVRETQIQPSSVSFVFDTNKFTASFDSILERSHQDEFYVSVAFRYDSAAEQSLEVFCDDPQKAPKFVLTLNSKSCCCPSGHSIVYSWSSNSFSATQTTTNGAVFS